MLHESESAHLSPSSVIRRHEKDARFELRLKPTPKEGKICWTKALEFTFKHVKNFILHLIA